MRKLALALLAFALVPSALALPPNLVAVEYGMPTCPHCLHMKELLSKHGIPYAFVDVTLSREDGEEYASIYNLLVGGTYYVPFTVFLVNGSVKLAVVGAVEPAQLEELLSKALNSTGILVAAPSDGGWSTKLVEDEAVIRAVEQAAAARTPATGEVRLLTPFGTPLARAEVEVACGDATYVAVTDLNGMLQLRCQSATIKVLRWLGTPINYTAAASVDSSVEVPGVGRVKVVALDALGRPVPDASVNFTSRWATLIGRTGSNGVLAADIPAGSYTLIVAKGGKAFHTPLEVGSGKVVEPEAKLDLVFAVGNVGVGFREILLAAATVAAALGALYAYTVRRRTARGTERQEPSTLEEVGSSSQP